MQQELNRMKRLIIIVLVIQAIVIAVLWATIKLNVLIPLMILIIEAIVLFVLFDRFDNHLEDHYAGVETLLNRTAKDAYLFGEVGMVMYDDNHVVTWMSDLFKERGINRIGRKVLVWLPEASGLLSGETDLITVQLDDKTYEVFKKDDEPVLLFKDITELHNLELVYEEGKPVIGMASLDNYEESTQYEDEAVVSAINVGVRTPLIDYCKEHNILVRRVNNYRYILVLNEKIFNDLADDRFSILNTVRKAAQKQDVSITLSMAFAMGTDNYQTLDEMVTKLMDLAQSRGGDQVAVQKAGEEVKYFGGSTEATEKRSRVRVRVMANTLKELISRSSNVIICGHKEADFDCIGSAIGVARMVEALNKPVSIIAKTGGIEEKLSEVLETHKEELQEEVTFVTENEAVNQLQEQSLVIMVDHHNVKQSNGAKVLEAAKNVAIIDHHRRSTEMGVQPVFVYIEASASSACELVTELFPYVSNRLEISELDANIMLAGMTIDTMRFRNRTGVRTFDAASALRRMGADPLVVDEFLKDTYSEFEEKNKILSMAKNYPNQVVVVPVQDMRLTRTMMSQVADSLLQISGVNAVFVISETDEEEYAISARSNGKVNVQVIMEMMEGGGHMTAAALQRASASVSGLESELKENLDQYFTEVHQDESDFEE
ncbi:MAG: DHH family phosphoesterase [Solobacterium sp.]|nr:DHH family phosphoesterase [Solobacterium sp.]